jgi:type I restriction enzyme, S subunit
VSANLQELPLPEQLPAIPEGWRYELLGDLVEERGVCYGIVQPGSETSDGVPVVRVNNIRNGRINLLGMLKVDRSIEAKFQRSRLRGGEVLLTLVGTLGEVAIVPNDFRGWNVARAVGVIPAKQDPGGLWVSICLRSAFIQHCIRAWATTTVQCTFNLRDLAKLPIPIPPPGIRQTITHILGTLDDKIELNRRMNATLEAMAQALFKSWFIDFDPVDAKLKGRKPIGMDETTAALFPSRYKESQLGKIPDEWTVGSILKHAKLLSGGTPKTERQDYWNGNISWASAKDVSQSGQTFLIDTERNITTAGLEKSATQMIPAFCTVVVARGATTGRMVVFGRDMAMNQTCYALSSSTNTPLSLYCQLRQEMRNLVHSAHGSVFNTITTTTFESSKVVLPPRQVLEVFEKTVYPTFHRILLNTEESATLATLRDTLLPKFLSGELRVPVLERQQEVRV